ncbi:MAG: hypothetical protein R3314_07895 [Longimicrobiales bacterium]|nr:hypothetical protein [Longimicrobiales bacterium]
MRRLPLLLLLLWPAAGLGQDGGLGPEARLSVDPTEAVHRLGSAPAAGGTPGWLTTPAGAFAASVVAPGAGQAALGLRRALLYGALELAFWGAHLEAAADYRRLSTAYRDLAWEVARTATAPGPRVDGTFGYYETLGQYVRSGAYDTDPGAAGLQPEEDPSTYNGTVWELARALFLPGGSGDPGSEEYEAALAYYRDQAVGPAFFWDWSGELQAMDRYRGIMRDADAEARLRSTALGLVLANHMVSAVDALLIARLRGDAGVHLESRIRGAPYALRWNVGLRISLRNE